MPSELMEINNKGELGTQIAAEQTRPNRLYVPRTDIYESPDHLLLMADMPGVKQDAVDITLEQNVLTIYGRVDLPEFPGYNLSYAEYGVGDYRRVFALSNDIDREAIQASVKNGVLKLILPKSKRAMPRKIAVQSE
ncbi:MAG: Hsp20/alpha crystallin family protein [Candidatus Obscuribacterales bacterium]|nr:Hsp20/alpha crystallin family protein [Candidatus Obscuribacterales bacterium]